MKAMLVDKHQTLVWSDVAEPICNDDTIIIDIESVAINRADILQRKGAYPSPKGWPEWMGLEVAGKVLAMGNLAKEESSFKVGDNVCALLGGGGYAERVAVPYNMVMPIPKGLTAVEAAALPEAYATSYLNLFYEGHLKAGQTVYIAAGASGLASVAIPMAKAFGAKVVTSVLNADIAKAIEPLGADIIVDTSREKLEDVFKALDEAGEPVNVAMDCLCGNTLGKCMQYMAEGGYWVVISTLAGTETNIFLRPLLTRGIHLVGSMLRKRSVDEKAALLDDLVKKVWPFLESGEIKPSIYKVLPISKAMEAHAILERGENIGKVVLTLK
ncbi:MAG: NAD(P)H-quinone oxidoreductase [Clostridia bacterium]|nr:NAD(P)H-quinone oxidoreductase [Clostridia bacterium]